MKKSTKYLAVVILLTCLYVSLFIAYLGSREFETYLDIDENGELFFGYEEVSANEPMYWLSLGIGLFSFVFFYKFIIHKKREWKQAKEKVDH